MHRTSIVLTLFALVALVAATPATAQVLINEIHYNPPGSDSVVGLEFVELYNAGGSAVDISGWELDFGPDPFVFPEGEPSFDRDPRLIEIPTEDVGGTSRVGPLPRGRFHEVDLYQVSLCDRGLRAHDPMLF